MGPSPANALTPNYSPVSQGLPTLLVMIAVLAIILLFCFWGAPGVREFCRRTFCGFCSMDEQNATPYYPDNSSGKFVMYATKNKQKRNIKTNKTKATNLVSLTSFLFFVTVATSKNDDDHSVVVITNDLDDKNKNQVAQVTFI